MNSHKPAVVVAAAWLALMTGLLVGGEVGDAVSFSIAGVCGVALVILGSAAAARCRVLPRRANAQRAGLALLAVALGAMLGLGNLGANWLIAEADPRLRLLLSDRMATLEPRVALIASPLVEEVLVRLLLMSVIAWLVFRVTKHATVAFAIALVGSAVIFAALHLARPFPDDPALANYYRTALMVKYTLAGLPLGLVFWRWGLPYAMICHIAANGVHLILQKGLFQAGTIA
jgi:membrane protease YdiL (CAAX protease family)